MRKIFSGLWVRESESVTKLKVEQFLYLDMFQCVQSLVNLFIDTVLRDSFFKKIFFYKFDFFFFSALIERDLSTLQQRKYKNSHKYPITSNSQWNNYCSPKTESNLSLQRVYCNVCRLQLNSFELFSCMKGHKNGESLRNRITTKYWWKDESFISLCYTCKHETKIFSIQTHWLNALSYSYFLRKQRFYLVVGAVSASKNQVFFSKVLFSTC